MNSIHDLIIFFIGAALSAVVSAAFGPFIEQIVSRFASFLLPKNDAALRGRWRSTYHYTNNRNKISVVQTMELTQIGRTVYGRNVDGSSYNGPRHAMKLHINGDWMTGEWRNTEHGARHHGVLQLHYLPNGKVMTGRWLGFDAKSSIRVGTWKWERLKTDGA